jgi:DNA (cytosine-5)-methyltransferase 1
MLKVLDLFSGIGGFSLGLEATGGFETVAFCEIEPYPVAVLKKHWPTVPVYEDVKTLTKDRLDTDGISVDVICGGFPCQDISLAGKGAGLAGERSGLWFEFHRLIEEIQPKYAIIENVSALRSRGLDQVLRSLAEIWYDAEWHCIPASAVGAPHRRDRIWIVAYPTSTGLERPIWSKLQRDGMRSTSGCSNMADTMQSRLEGQRDITSRISEKLKDFSYFSWWEVEPNVGRVADGVPHRPHRLRALGNAVVPQIPQMIGNAILSWYSNQTQGDLCVFIHKRV